MTAHMTSAEFLGKHYPSFSGEFTEQIAEAYAAYRVRAALEEAASIVDAVSKMHYVKIGAAPTLPEIAVRIRALLPVVP